MKRRRNLYTFIGLAVVAATTVLYIWRTPERSVISWTAFGFLILAELIAFAGLSSLQTMPESRRRLAGTMLIVYGVLAAVISLGFLDPKRKNFPLLIILQGLLLLSLVILLIVTASSPRKPQDKTERRLVKVKTKLQKAMKRLPAASDALKEADQISQLLYLEDDKMESRADEDLEKCADRLLELAGDQVEAAQMDEVFSAFHILLRERQTEISKKKSANTTGSASE